jgi:hypothetical protein
MFVPGPRGSENKNRLAQYTYRGLRQIKSELSSKVSSGIGPRYERSACLYPIRSFFTTQSPEYTGGHFQFACQALLVHGLESAGLSSRWTLKGTSQ